LNEAAERFRSSGKATRAILDVSSGASLRDDGPKELIDDRGKLHGSVQGLLPFKEIGVMLCGFQATQPATIVGSMVPRLI